MVIEGYNFVRFLRVPLLQLIDTVFYRGVRGF